MQKCVIDVGNALLYKRSRQKKLRLLLDNCALHLLATRNRASILSRYGRPLGDGCVLVVTCSWVEGQVARVVFRDLRCLSALLRVSRVYNIPLKGVLA